MPTLPRGVIDFTARSLARVAAKSPRDHSVVAAVCQLFLLLLMLLRPARAKPRAPLLLHSDLIVTEPDRAAVFSLKKSQPLPRY
jgi:hypothetical protein